MDGKLRRLLISLCFIALVTSSSEGSQRQSADEIAKSGWEAFQGGNPMQAKADLTQAIHLSPGKARYHAALAEINWSLRAAEDAAREFEIATKLEPTNAAVRSRLGQLYQLMGRDLDVIRVLRPPYPPEPLQSVWRFSRGFSLFRLGRLEASRREFLPLVNHSDFQAPANFFLGRINFTQNRFEKALPYFATAVRIGDSPTNKEYSSYAYDYGLTLFKLGRYAEANEQFRLSTQRYAQEPLAWMMRGRCDEELKDYQAAIDDYEQSIKVDPKFELSYYHLARLQQRYGDKQRADELFKHLGNLREADIREAQARAEKQAMLKAKSGAAPSGPSNTPTP